MRRPSVRHASVLLVAALATGGVAAAEPSAQRSAAAVPVAGTACPVFPASSFWNTDVRSLPVDPRSPVWLSHMSTGRNLHPDFGPSYGDGPNYGIPVTVAAMKTYGLVLADNGSPWFFTGEQNRNWPPALVEELKRIPASAFEAVDTSALQAAAG